MRIISQNGYIDLPYERTHIVLRERFIIAKCDGEQYLFAQYRTEEKAIKAMKMCREYYDSIFFEPQPEIFQFPAKEEVE